MSKLNSEDVIYCAGLYEGEGTVGFSIQKAKRRYHSSTGRLHNHKEKGQLQLAISMTDKEPLMRFTDTFDIGRYSVGQMYGPYLYSNKKPLYRLQYIGFMEVQFVVAAIWPWLSPRRKTQYKKAIEDYTLWTRL
jgi:hypothetical protein